jgi:NitT/TauT family transport system permease protein
MALEPDKRSGDYLFWLDTAASLLRLLAGLTTAAAIGLVLGIAIGLVPYVRASLAAFLAVVCMVPPLAILPILFITLGLGRWPRSP